MSRYRKPRNPDHDELMTDLEEDTTHHFDEQPATRGALRKIDARVRHLEEVTHILTLPGGPASGEALMAKAAYAYDGEQVLAKAAQAYVTPDGLLALAEREVSDPTVMGVIAGHISSGNITEAQNLLIDVQERSRFAKAADVAADLTAGLPEQDDGSELRERFGRLEQAFALILSRIDRLETRPRPQAATVPGQTVAKGVNVTTKKRRSKEEIADDLTRQIDRYIDSPQTAGALSSLVQAGRFNEVRPVLERARQAHETERIKNERAGFKR